MRRTCLAFLLLTSVAWAGSPEALVTGPSKPVPEGGAVVLDASKSTSAYDLVWTVTPPTPLLAVDRPPQRFAFLPQPAPGEYIVTVVALSINEGGKPTGSVATIKVLVGSSPAPGPTPIPAPPDDKPGPVNPTPVAYVGPLVVTLVYDPATMTPALASLKDSRAVPLAFKGLDARYMTLATTVDGQPSAEYTRRGLAPFVATLGGLPVLIFQSPDGKVIHKAAAPPDESGVVAAVQQLRGVKTSMIRDYRLDGGDLLPGIEDHTGEVRILGRTPPPPGKLLATAPAWKSAKQVIPERDWGLFMGDTRRDDVIPMKDQNGRGACNGFAWIEVLEGLRLQEGQTPLPLSAWFLYAMINGGRDAGSNISDGAAYLTRNGIPLDSAVPQGSYLKRQIPQSAYNDLARFMIPEGETFACEDYDDIGSAICLGYKVNLSICVGNDFNNLDADYAPPVHRGAGNHAESAGEGFHKARSGLYLPWVRNHWTPKWGNRGYHTLRRGHIENQSYFEAIATKSATFDPKDPNRVPPARA